MSRCPESQADCAAAGGPSSVRGAPGARGRAARRRGDGARDVRVVPVPAQRGRPGHRDRARDGTAPPARGEHPGPARGRGPGADDGRGVRGTAADGRGGLRGGRRRVRRRRGASRRGRGSRCCGDAARQAAWRVGTTGLGGALLAGAETGVRALDARLGAGGRLASIPLAVPVGLGLSYVVERRRVQPAGCRRSSRRRRHCARWPWRRGWSGAWPVAPTASICSPTLAGRRVARLLPAPPAVGRVVGPRRLPGGTRDRRLLVLAPGDAAAGGRARPPTSR